MSRTFSLKSILGAAVVIALLALCLGALAWRLEGGRWYVVRTPSMGQAAPVGTLLLTKPTTIADIHVGEIITFRAPTSGQVYSHRVVEKTAAGLRTRGDINTETDPWTLTQKNVIGQVVHRWWGCGWILRGVPLLLICLAVLWLATAYFARVWRSPIRVVGSALSFAFVAAYLHPWVGIERLSTTAGSNGPVVHLVSVGVLPIRASAQYGGDHADLVNGQVADVAVTKSNSHGAYNISAALHLSLGWWIAIILVCVAPLLWTVVVGLDPAPLEVDPQSEEEDSGLALVGSKGEQ